MPSVDSVASCRAADYKDAIDADARRALKETMRGVVVGIVTSQTRRPGYGTAKIDSGCLPTGKRLRNRLDHESLHGARSGRHGRAREMKLTILSGSTWATAPSCPRAAKEVRLVDLATHRSGLLHQLSTLRQIVCRRIHANHAVMHGSFWPPSLQRDIGEKYVYSNSAWPAGIYPRKELDTYEEMYCGGLPPRLNDTCASPPRERLAQGIQPMARRRRIGI
jgi:hypothetical protein